VDDQTIEYKCLSNSVQKEIEWSVSFAKMYAEFKETTKKI